MTKRQQQRASLKHAVLGLVLERPGYGYGLGNRLDARFPHWQSTGVYDALDRLQADGLVIGAGEKGRSTQRSAPKTVYHGTDAGREFFHDWLLQPTPFTPPRHDLDLKIALSGPDEWPALIDQVSGQEALCMNVLQGLVDARAGIRPISPRLTWPEASAMLQRNAEIKYLQVRIDWLQEVRTTMRLLLERRPKAL
jgi:DNA-binding PadR family transcriptional regulator